MPEIARRLGNPFFTRNLIVTQGQLADFVERPSGTIDGGYCTLDTGSRSALALVFMRGGMLPSPVATYVAEEKALRCSVGSWLMSECTECASKVGLCSKPSREGNTLAFQTPDC